MLLVCQHHLQVGHQHLDVDSRTGTRPVLVRPSLFFLFNDELEEAYLGEVPRICDSVWITRPLSQTLQLQLCETQILGHGSDATGEHG